MSNGTGEQRPNSGQGISTATWPGSEAICSMELYPGRSQLILYILLSPIFKTQLETGHDVD